MTVILKIDPETARNIGYCISRVEFSGDAEMESLYVLENYPGDTSKTGRKKI